MAVIPSFSGFAATPNLVGAATAADTLRQRSAESAMEFMLAQDRLAQQAAADAARIGIARQQLESEEKQTLMQLQASKETHERERLRREHEDEVMAAYRKAQIDISKGHLAVEEKNLFNKTQEAAAELSRQQAYDRLFQAGVAKGLSPQEAARQAILQSGIPGAGALTQAIQGERERPPRMFDVAVANNILTGTPTRTRMTGPEFQSWFPTAPPSMQTNALNMATQKMLAPTVPMTNAPPVGLTIPTNLPPRSTGLKVLNIRRR